MATALAGVGCGQGKDPVVTELEGALAETTFSEDGLHTELVGLDGTLLAAMDLGATAGTWQHRDGELQSITVIESSAPGSDLYEILRSDRHENALSVSALPGRPEEANLFLYDLFRAKEHAVELEAAQGEVPYGCTYYSWDNMDCIYCVYLDCIQCSEYCCAGPGVPGGLYCSPACPTLPPGTLCS